MVLRAESVEGSVRSLRFTADIVGGPDNNQDLYCTSTLWDFGDGLSLIATPSCIAWTPEVKIPRDFEQTHAYAPGTYEVTFSRGTLEARLVVEVP